MREKEEKVDGENWKIWVALLIMTSEPFLMSLFVIKMHCWYIQDDKLLSQASMTNKSKRIQGSFFIRVVWDTAKTWGGASASLESHFKSKQAGLGGGAEGGGGVRAVVGPCWIYLFLHVWRWLCKRQHREQASKTDRQTDRLRLERDRRQEHAMTHENTRAHTFSPLWADYRLFFG